MTAVGPVVYAVTVNGSPVTDPPLNAALTQAWGQHDIFTIRIEYNRGSPMNSIAEWPANAPVTVVWGRRPHALQTWYGYVNHAEQKSNADSGDHNLQYTYTLIGTSRPMNTSSGTSWGTVTPTYIARQMAARYGFRAVLTSTTRLLAGEVQAGTSDFTYMNTVAQKAGMRFWASGGTLYLIDPAVILAGNARQGVPAFRQDKLMTQQDTMRDFAMLKGDNLPGSAVATRQVYGIDATSGHLFASSAGTGTVTKVNTARAVSSWGEANQVAAAQQGLSQFWAGATAELFGDTSIYPGKVVYLEGDALPGGNAGYWIVASAKQVLRAAWTPVATNDAYVTQAVLLRNASGTLPQISGLSVVSPEFVPCSLNGATWQSSSMAVIYDGTS